MSLKTFYIDGVKGPKELLFRACHYPAALHADDFGSVPIAPRDDSSCCFLSLVVLEAAAWFRDGSRLTYTCSYPDACQRWRSHCDSQRLILCVRSEDSEIDHSGVQEEEEENKCIGEANTEFGVALTGSGTRWCTSGFLEGDPEAGFFGVQNAII
ncbi:hypothetical protein VTL71DRAFT_16383 [Oculimacula yallundae]|uniref:Uncharacterized protein n=1 Tax=Oculimacula yallundae TaxID=86028 RepID=A0ABR4CEB4_9HELO